MKISSRFRAVAVGVIVAAGVGIASAAELKEGVQTPPGGHEMALRRELAAARAELEIMQRAVRDASAQAHALATTVAKQAAQTLKEQQQIDEALETAQRVIEDFRAEAILWDREQTAGAHPSMEASQLAVKRALDEERRKVELLQQELTTARQTIDALKTDANLAAVEKTNAIKDRSVAETALKQAGEALELERERADSAVRDLDIVRQERDASKQVSAELSAALEQERERAAGAHPSVAASQIAAKRALDEKRRKVELLQQELTTARQTIDALKTDANLAAVEKTNAIKDRSMAETALKQAGEALELERERADSAVRDLDIVRQERDASRQVSAELSAALEQERERAIDLARSLSAARKAIDLVKDKRRTAAVERAPKARNPASGLGNTLSRSDGQPAGKSRLQEKRKVKVQKSPQPVLRATIALPAALLPTRPPKKLNLRQ
ncbi:hypothetical protein [Mesorhizobium sp. f-mel]